MVSPTDPFGNVPRRCFLIGRQRGEGQLGKILEKIEKILETSGKREE